MGGMPMLDTSNWLHQVTGLYLTIVPCYFLFNNFIGPKAMEPVFTKDFLISALDKIGSSGASDGSAPKQGYVATSGKAPVLPKNLFARFGGPRTRAAISFASIGLLAISRPIDKKKQ